MDKPAQPFVAVEDNGTEYVLVPKFRHHDNTHRGKLGQTPQAPTLLECRTEGGTSVRHFKGKRCEFVILEGNNRIRVTSAALPQP